MGPALDLKDQQTGFVALSDAALSLVRVAGDRTCRDGCVAQRVWHDLLVDESLSALLTELCVDFGFCHDPADYQRLSSQTWERSADLANAVFAAEGMSEPYDAGLWREVRDRIALRLR